MGRLATIVKRPPIMVSGTTETIPARMADRYVFSLTAVRAGTRYLLRTPVAWLLTRGFPKPVVQRRALLINLLEGPRDIVHIRSRPQEQAVFEPNRLLPTEQVAVGTARAGVIEARREFRKIGAKRFAP